MFAWIASSTRKKKRKKKKETKKLDFGSQRNILTIKK